MELVVTPYRICTCIFIRVYCEERSRLRPKENADICLFILDIIRQNEYTFKQFMDLMDAKCDYIVFERFIDIINHMEYLDYLFEQVKKMRECNSDDIGSNSVAGLYLRKLTIYFDRLTHQACSRLFDDLLAYFAVSHSKTGQYSGVYQVITRKMRSGESYEERFREIDGLFTDVPDLRGAIVRRRKFPRSYWLPNRTTRSSEAQQQGLSPANLSFKQQSRQQHQHQHQQQQSIRPVHRIDHEIARLQANEDRAMSPKDLYEFIKRPTITCKSDAAFLRYLNLLRVNESVGSKHLLLAYFDMMSDSVSRSYSALNYAIWYLHHSEYKRAIECLKECYCCAQAADDDKCLLIALMWLSRILIQAKQKNSSKYNVKALLELVQKRSHKAGMAYVQAMSSMTLEQLNGPVDDSEKLKKSSEMLKEVAQSSRQQNLLMTTTQANPLDKEDGMPSAELLAVRNSMNDVLAMSYALASAHLCLIDANQSSALASQTLLHFDLIEKCGNEDVFLMNENIFIAVRNLAYHVWNSTRNINLAREILVDLCSSKIPKHRTDSHSIWRRAYAEISFEHCIEQENWAEASKMVSILRETDLDGAQLRKAELLQSLGINDEALEQVDDLIRRIEYEESNLFDPVDSMESSGSRRGGAPSDDSSWVVRPSLSIEHRSFIKSKALLLRAILLDDETKMLDSLQYANENRFMHVRTACLMQLARRWVDKTEKIMDSIVVEIFANGTRLEKQELRRLLEVL